MLYLYRVVEVKVVCFLKRSCNNFSRIGDPDGEVEKEATDVIGLVATHSSRLPSHFDDAVIFASYAAE